MEILKNLTKEVGSADELLKTGFDFSLSRNDIRYYESLYQQYLQSNNEQLKVLLGY